LRDQASIAVRLDLFARSEATLRMGVGDDFPQGKRRWYHHEKGGTHHDMPAHQMVED
jgi:hypothetical protein